MSKQLYMSPHQRRLSIKLTGGVLSDHLMLKYELRSEKTGLQGFPTRSHTNWAVQSHKMARSLKFRI